jgi:hypothetical protein
VAFRRLSERRIQATPKTGATGIVPGGDQMDVPGAVRGDEPEDVPTDTVLGSGDQTGGTELLHQCQKVQRPKVAFAPVTGVISTATQ